MTGDCKYAQAYSSLFSNRYNAIIAAGPWWYANERLEWELKRLTRACRPNCVWLSVGENLVSFHFKYLIDEYSFSCGMSRDLPCKFQIIFHLSIEPILIIILCKIFILSRTSMCIKDHQCEIPFDYLEKSFEREKIKEYRWWNNLLRYGEIIFSCYSLIIQSIIARRINEDSRGIRWKISYMLIITGYEAMVRLGV